MSTESQKEFWSDWVASTGKRPDGKAMLKSMRFALTGMSFGPPLASIMTILGEKEIVKRIALWKARS